MMFTPGPRTTGTISSSRPIKHRPLTTNRIMTYSASSRIAVHKPFTIDPTPGIIVAWVVIKALMREIDQVGEPTSHPGIQMMNLAL